MDFVVVSSNMELPWLKYKSKRQTNNITIKDTSVTDLRNILMHLTIYRQI